MKVLIETATIAGAEGYVLAQRDGRLVIVRSTATPGTDRGGPRNQRFKNVGGR